MSRSPGELSRRSFLGLTGSAAIGAGLVPACSSLETDSVIPDAPTSAFREARPVWPRGRQSEMNLFVGFRCLFARPRESQPVILRIAGGSLYRIFLNGQFIGHGPARGPHGYLRLDQWPLPSDVLRYDNVLAIEIAGVNVNSYYLIDQPPYLQAEIVTGKNVLAATAARGSAFEADILKERLQNVQRYSFQRTFVEAYRLTPDFESWRFDPKADFSPIPLDSCDELPLLPRRVAYPSFFCRPAKWQAAHGRVAYRAAQTPWTDRSLNNVGPDFLGYQEDELEFVLSEVRENHPTVDIHPDRKPLGPDDLLDLEDKAFSIVDLGTNLTGFIGLRLQTDRRVRLLLLFDEILQDGDIDHHRMPCVNAISLDLDAGDVRFESFEPYTLRYLKIICIEGSASVSSIYLREYVASDVDEAHFACADPRLNRLFEAGRETYRQNAVDVFMDCPSRERAGWLCDSFFTARTAGRLCHEPTVETCQFENYLLPERFAFLPDGMLPMCYPADHNDGVFIPNWSLWFVVQLEEYVDRSGNREMVSALQGRVEALFTYFDGFVNDDGLLEQLESWVFVEWSEANSFVQDVNYPSNMLFAAALTAAGRLYERTDWIDSAENIRKTIREQSFDGQFFVDNAIRRAGGLEITNNRTEVCQYFAFFFGVASPASHPGLWETLKNDFGPDRDPVSVYPEVHPANAFVGNVLRLELLSREGLGQHMLDESVSYLLYMAKRTGTLWEHDDPSASCNHGFASHIVHSLYRDVLGCHTVSEKDRSIRLRFTDVGLPWCEGVIPCKEGFIKIRWEKSRTGLRYAVDVPSGYTVDVDNAAGLTLEQL